MKKILFASALLLLAGISARAQGANEALLLGENNYYGTARSVALGNAMTALGGDLGSIGINPAGSAVNKWSQFTLTPALSIYAGQSNMTTPGGANPFSPKSRLRVNLPNIGAVLAMDMHKTSGLKVVSFGFVANTTEIYNKDILASGLNNGNSYMGYLADYATRYNIASSKLDGKISDLDYYTDWPAAIAYQTGVVNAATGNNGAPYVSPVQDKTSPGYPMRGKIEQTFSYREKGSKQDYLMNMGLNFSDRFFVGVNLGLISVSYTRDVKLIERADNPHDFSCDLPEGDGTTVPGYFEDMTYNYQYVVSGGGIYGKIGIIAVPFEGLRIGASVQTPTATNLREYRWYRGSSNFTDGTKSHSHGGDKDSPDYTGEYDLRMPARFNFGLAYTLPGVGLLSVDYELTDFGTSRYSDYYDYSTASFGDSNNEISNYLGIAHYLRAGLEFKLGNIALRGGYNLAITPALSSSVFDNTILGAIDKLYTHTASAGVGYDSGGFFFMDFALKARLNPDRYYYLYPTETAPEITASSSLWNALLTFGFRF